MKKDNIENKFLTKMLVKLIGRTGIRKFFLCISLHCNYAGLTPRGLGKHCYMDAATFHWRSNGWNL